MLAAAVWRETYTPAGRASLQKPSHSSKVHCSRDFEREPYFPSVSTSTPSGMFRHLWAGERVNEQLNPFVIRDRSINSPNNSKGKWSGKSTRENLVWSGSANSKGAWTVGLKTSICEYKVKHLLKKENLVIIHHHLLQHVLSWVWELARTASAKSTFRFLSRHEWQSMMFGQTLSRSTPTTPNPCQMIKSIINNLHKSSLRFYSPSCLLWSLRRWGIIARIDKLLQYE